MATKKSSDPRVATLAGAIGGGLEATATWPTEFVKTQMQMQKILPDGTTKPAPGQPQVYRNAVHCFRSIVGREGPLGVYRGLGPIVAMSLPKSGIRFGAFSVYSSAFFRDKDGKMTTGKNFVCGLMCGATEAVLVVTPQETLKTKLINSNAGFVSGTMNLIKTQGFRSIYQGVVPTIGKQASNQGIRFVTFGEYKKRVMNWTGSDQLTPVQALIGGMTAGCCSVLGNNPVDCIKTRMQGTNATQYAGTVDCILQTLRKEGPLAFYKGVLPRMGRVVPGQGIVFLSYETITRYLEDMLLDEEAKEKARRKAAAGK